jgi:hypothetical protein
MKECVGGQRSAKVLISLSVEKDMGIVSKRGVEAIPSRQTRGGQWALDLHQRGFQVLYDISSEAYIRVVLVITTLRVLPVRARMRNACVWLSEWNCIHLQLQTASALICTYKRHA